MALTQDEVLAEFRAAGALLEGHFILSSGLHSPRYLQCARVLMDAARGDGLLRCAGVLGADWSPEDDAILGEIEQARQLSSHRELPE